MNNNDWSIFGNDDAPDGNDIFDDIFGPLAGKEIGDVDAMVEMQVSATSRDEAIALTGDDTFYEGPDKYEDFDDEDGNGDEF